MRAFFKAALAIPVAGTILTTSLFTAPAQAVWKIRVSQESTAGAGDFDTNILGFIDAFETTDTIADFYGYSRGSFVASFNGPVSLTSDATHHFFVHASDGLGFYTVHDSPQDGSGGSASMDFNLVGDPDDAAILFKDDPDSVDVGDIATPGLGIVSDTFSITQSWAVCCTDGSAIGSLDGYNWELFAEFSALPGGINDWLAVSADESGPISLQIDPDRRVRFDKVKTPEPASALSLLAIGALGSVAILKRRQNKQS